MKPRKKLKNIQKIIIMEDYHYYEHSFDMMIMNNKTINIHLKCTFGWLSLFHRLIDQKQTFFLFFFKFTSSINAKQKPGTDVLDKKTGCPDLQFRKEPIRVRKIITFILSETDLSGTQMTSHASLNLKILRDSSTDGTVPYRADHTVALELLILTVRN